MPTYKVDARFEVKRPLRKSELKELARMVQDFLANVERWNFDFTAKPLGVLVRKEDE